MLRSRGATNVQRLVNQCTHHIGCSCGFVPVARRFLSTSSSIQISSFSSSSSRPTYSAVIINALLRSSLVSNHNAGFPHSAWKTHCRTFASYPDHIMLTMPALSPTMEKGNIAKWNKKEGDEVKVGDSMADIETDKATMGFESVEAGYIAKILVADGTSDVVVGTPIAVLAENKDDVSKFKDFKAEGETETPTETTTATGKDEGKKEKKDEEPTASSSEQIEKSASSGRVIASPLAKKIAGEKGIALNELKGTGPDGRIVAADVNEAAVPSKAKAAAPAAKPSAKAAPPSSTGDYVDIPHSNVRKVIASRLLLSKQTIPHYYLTSEVTMDALLGIRSELNSKAGVDGVKLSVNDFIVKAAALACRKVPEANSSWMDNAIRKYNYVDMSVAVSTDSGLITPVIKDADIKGLIAISAETKSLAKKAREGKLQPAEYQGGTFTISNLGMFGVTQFAAIINPPQAAILAIGASHPKVIEGTVKGQYTTAQVMSVTLSCDHRVVDGAVGAQWLQAFKGYIENPITMLL